MVTSYPRRWESLRSEQFDPLALWRRVGEDMQLLRELVGIFAAEYPEMLRGMKEAVQQRDAAKLQEASHMLKGSLLQLSAFRAASVAAELEGDADAASLDAAGKLIGKVGTELDSLMRLLNTMISCVHAEPGVQLGNE